VSDIVAIALTHFSELASHKPHICHFDPIPHRSRSRGISISGFDGHIVISGCRSLSRSPIDTLS